MSDEFLSRNMHYIYNKEYFDKIIECNEASLKSELGIINYTFPDSIMEAFDGMKKIAGEHFELTTVYPGLMIGLGYPHSSGVKESFVGGFYFDEITGVPVIPGSTIKGMLRYYFKYNDIKNNDDITPYVELIVDLVGDILIDLEKNEKEKFIKSFINNSFESEESEDVFLGAIPQINPKERVFMSEYITPHNSPTEAPVPLKMLKVRPGIKYDFLFILSDFTYRTGDGKEIVLSKEKKLEIFKKLILRGGVGAKTNVGFGQFTDEIIESKNEPDRYILLEKKKENNNHKKNNNTNEISKEIVKAKIYNIKNGYINLKESESIRKYSSLKEKVDYYQKRNIKLSVGDEISVRFLKKVNNNGKQCYKYELVEENYAN